MSCIFGVDYMISHICWIVGLNFMMNILIPYQIDLGLGVKNSLVFLQEQECSPKIQTFECAVFCVPKLRQSRN